MSSEDISIVTQILSSILNPNADIRNEAVEKLNQLKQNIPALAYCLLQIISMNIQDEGMKLAKTVGVVLLRQLLEIKSDEIDTNKWQNFDSNIKEQIRSISLKAFINEKDKSLKQKIGEVIIQIAENSEDCDEKWDDLMSLIIDTMKLPVEVSENELHIIGALNILAGTIGLIYDELIVQGDLLLSTVRAYFKSSNLTIRVKTSKFICEMLSYSNKKEVKILSEFLLPIMEAALKCLESGDEQNLKASLKIITDMCSQEPTIWKKHFSDLFILMDKITSKKDFDNENLREMAFEVIVNLVERKYVLFSKDIDKLKHFLGNLFKYALEMSKEISSEWTTPEGTSYDDEEFIKEEKVATSFSFVDRLIEFIGIEVMLPLLSEIVNGMIAITTDWRYCYIGLLSISHMMNKVEDMATVESIFPVIFTHVKSTCPKIRYAAVNCVNEISESFEPYFESKYKENTIPLIIEMLAGENVLRVQLELLDTLHTFISFSTTDVICPYAANILEISFALFLKDIPVILRREILGVIAELVSILDEKFQPYSENSLKILLEYYGQIYSMKTNKHLYGNLLECITLIGPLNEAIYLPVFADLLKSVIEITEGIHLSTDPLRGFIQQALEQMIPIVQKNFHDMIPPVVNSVLLLIKTVPEMSVSTSPEAKFDIVNLLGSQAYEEDDAKKKTSIKTSDTEEMTESIDLLNTVIEALGNEFLPYIPQTHEDIFPLLTYKINEDIRKKSAMTIPLLMNIIAAHAKDHAADYEKLYLQHLLAAIEKETDNESLGTQMECLGDVINSVDMTLNKDEVNQLFWKMMTFFDNLEKKRLALLAKKSDERKHAPDDDDSDDDLSDILERDIEDIEDVHSQLSDAIGFLFKTHKSLSEDIVTTIINQIFPKYLRADASNFEIRMGICIADDMIEFLGQDYLKGIWDNLAQVIVALCNNPDHAIRQAASYGVGIFAQHTKENYDAYAKNFITALSQALGYTPKEDEEQEWGLAKDNTVASIGKIIKYQGESSIIKANLPEMISIWVKNLPILYDSSEWDEQHDLLCDIILNRSELIFGDQLEHAQMIVRIFAKIYQTKKSNDAINSKIEQIFQRITTNETLKQVVLDIYNSSERKIKIKLQKLVKNE